MPARECCEQEEGQEGEDNGDDDEVGKDDGVLEGACNPNKVERVFVDRDQVR